jgi:YidC/Oxa1 family membrane protein insertase
MSQILYPLEYTVAWIMVTFHRILTLLGLPEASGWTWALSIIGLVVVIRIVLIPLFVKQIKASRGLQLIQPQVQAIQKKYKGKTDPDSRQAMTQETMALYKESGTNPFASCLPIILQAPIFFALFRVLNEYVARSRGIGPDLDEDHHSHTDRVDVGLDLHHAAPADDEEHAGIRPGQPLRQAAEVVAVRPAGRLRGLRGELSDRRLAVLADDEPLVDGSAVLRHPTDAGSGLTRGGGDAGSAASKRGRRGRPVGRPRRLPGGGRGYIGSRRPASSAEEATSAEAGTAESARGGSG